MKKSEDKAPRPADNAPGRKRAAIWGLAGILAAGLTFRLLYLGEIRGLPAFSHPTVDAAFHDYWARGIATGDWTVPEPYDDPLIRQRPYFRPPAYAYFLASIYSVFGHGCLAPRLVQMAFGLLSCALAFVFGRKWFGPGTGIAFAALMAVYWVFIYFEGELLDAAMDVFFTVLLLWAASLWMERLSLEHGLLTGIVLGVYTLFRPNVILFWPVLIAWRFWLGRRSAAVKRLLLSFAGFLIGTIAAVTPCFLRNYLIAGDPVPISANAGMSLAVGNNENADGTNHYLPGFGQIGSPFDYPRAVKGLEKQLGVPLGSLRYSEVSRHYIRQALSFIRTHPLSFLKLTARKAALFWGPYEVTNNQETYFARLNSRVLRNLPLNFPLVLALAVVGAVLFFFSCNVKRVTCNVQRATFNGLPPSRQQYEIAVLVVLFIGVYFISALPFVAADRYRVPLLPCLLFFGSLGLVALARALLRRRFVRVALIVAAGAAAFLVVRINLAGYQPSPAKWHYDAALAFAAEGEIEEAIAEYRRALTVFPDYRQARNNLGALLVRTGRYEEAIVEYREAIAIGPAQGELLSNLGDALSRQGKVEEAIGCFHQALKVDPECVQAYNNLGIALDNRARRPEAIRQYEKALELKPDYDEAHYNLGIALGKMGKLEEAISHYRQAIRINPGYAPAHNNLGNALAEGGQLEEAAGEYRAALKLDPDLPDAHNNLANILASRGRFAEAFEHYQRALQLKPDYGQAYFNLGLAFDLEGRRSEAEESLRKAVELVPGAAAARYRLALVLIKGGAPDEAREQLRKALEIDPQFEAARRALESIEKR